MSGHWHGEAVGRCRRHLPATVRIIAAALLAMVGLIPIGPSPAQATGACPGQATPIPNGGCLYSGSGPARPVQTVVLVRPDTGYGEEGAAGIARVEAAVRTLGQAKTPAWEQPVWVGPPSPPARLAARWEVPSGDTRSVVVTWARPQQDSSLRDQGGIALAGYDVEVRDETGQVVGGSPDNSDQPVSVPVPGDPEFVEVSVTARNAFTDGAGQGDASGSTACVILRAPGPDARTAPCAGRGARTAPPANAVTVTTAAGALNQTLRDDVRLPVAVIPVLEGSPLEDRLESTTDQLLDSLRESGVVDDPGADQALAIQLLSANPRSLAALDTLPADLEQALPATPTSPPRPALADASPTVGLDAEAAAAPASASDRGSALPLLAVAAALVVLAVGAGAVLVARTRHAPSLATVSPTRSSGGLATARVASGAGRPDADERPGPGPPRPDRAWPAVAFLAAPANGGSQPDTPMHITPDLRDGGRSWALEDDGLIAVATWSTPGVGTGEDADPTLLFDWSTGLGLIATYDGVGGAGAGVVEQSADGHDRSGAYVAARAAREATEQWFLDSLARRSDDTPPNEALHRAVRDRLVAESDRLGPSSGRIAGSLVRRLPTTLAAVAFRARAGDVVALALWAGDSRCLVLGPDDGLQQLSVDDTPITDALQAIVTDSPMSNMACADRPFVVNTRRHVLARPLVLLAATDGCFGYVATPAHFEFLLLQTLAEATSSDDWADRLLSAIRAVAGDDASMAAVALGFGDFASLQSAFAARRARLDAEHWQPMMAVDPDDREAFTEARARSWADYRAGYEARLDGVGAAAGDRDRDGGSVA